MQFGFLVLHFCLSSSLTFSFDFDPNFSSFKSNWALLISTSRYWFNYRHFSNTLSVYRSIKRLGIPDSHIILMLADDIGCNSRNQYTPHIYGQQSKSIDLFPPNVEVDYKGCEVNVENLFRLLTGRHYDYTPYSKSLLMDEYSNLLVYMSGHGGDGFLKFQDNEELLSLELHDTFTEMRRNRRFNEMFFMVDSCQANTMFSSFTLPGILASASSKLGEDSLSHHFDNSLGLHLMDKWTYYMLLYLENIIPLSNISIDSLLNSFDAKLLQSTPSYKNLQLSRDLHLIPLIDFFGSVRKVHFEEFRNFICYPWNTI